MLNNFKCNLYVVSSYLHELININDILYLLYILKCMLSYTINIDTKIAELYTHYF